MEIDNKIDQLKREYDTNISTRLNNIKSQDLYIYLTIIVAAMFIAKLIDINLSIVFFLVVGLIICYIIYSQREISSINRKKQFEIKRDLIKPLSKYLGHDHEELTELIFQVRQFYYVNPNEFYDIIKSIDIFLELYDEMMHYKVIYCHRNFQVAETLANTILNKFHSLVYELNTDFNMTQKWRLATRELNIILFQYLEQLREHCSAEKKEEEVNIESAFPEPAGPKASNWYNEPHYQFY